WTGTGNTGFLAGMNNGGGRPVFSYFKYSYTADDLFTKIKIPIIGTLVAINVNVTTPYTGSQPPLAGFVTDNMMTPDHTAQSSYFPQIDVKTAGARQITPTSVTFLPSDPAFGSSPPGALWFGGHQDVFPNPDVDVRSENAGPVIEVEWIVDPTI